MDQTSPSPDWFSFESSTFGDRVAGARESIGLSQAQLARRLGVKLKTLQGWENDVSEPRANKLQLLAGILNVSLTWLLTAEGDGLDGPVQSEKVDQELLGVLQELRLVRADMSRNAERLARVEKRLAKHLETAAVA
ncbi:MAG: helix-turn-helix transcriptional regulator [Pseudomonadota bacterium]